MKKILLIIALIFTALPVFAADNNADKSESVYDRVMRTNTLRCGYFTWPPFLTKDPNTGKISGISADYINALADELGIKIEWTEETGVGEWISGLNSNRFDLMCVTVWPDAAILKSTIVTNPAYFSTVYAVVRNDDKRFDGDINLINKADIKIAGIDGDITYNIATKDFSNAQILALPQMSDSSQLLQSVVTKKADVTFVDFGLMQDFIASNGPKLRIVKNIPPVKVFPELLALKNGEIQMKLLLDSVINILTNNGVSEKILKKYTTSSYPPIISYEIKK